MAKFVLFLFFAVCVAAVQMSPVPESENEDQFDLSQGPDVVIDDDGRVNIPWKKVWEIAKPILKEAGKAAGREIIKGIEDKLEKH